MFQWGQETTKLLFSLGQHVLYKNGINKKWHEQTWKLTNGKIKKSSLWYIWTLTKEKKRSVCVSRSVVSLCELINCGSLCCHGILQARKLEWVAISFFRGSTLAQGSNLGLPHCRQILYQLSHQRSPRIVEWVAYPFFRRTFQPRNQTGVSCIAGRFFTSWATREAWNKN